MAPHILPFPAPQSSPSKAARAQPALVLLDRDHLARNAEDGTLPLLHSGFLISGIAAAGLLLTLYALGGIGAEGPQSNLGWLSLMIALMSMPFGLLLLLFGGAKWLRNHWLSRASRASQQHPRR